MAVTRQNANTKPDDPGEEIGGGRRTDAGSVQGLGVREQFDLLKQIQQAESSEPGVSAGPLSFLKSALARRSIKTAVALALVIALGWVPLRRLFLVTSAEATVNAKLITLRSPIDGQVMDWRRHLRAGTSLHPGETILRVEDSRADRTRLDELRRSQSAVIDQRKSSAERLAMFEGERAEHLELFNTFRRYRVSHIEARRNEAIADKQAAAARLDAAEASLRRASALFDRGNQTQANLDQVLREQKIASAALVAAERRLQATEIELAAARVGTFVTDGFNDIPRSAQRASELGQLIAETKVAMAEQDRRLESLQSQIGEERERFQKMSAAVMNSPTEGQIWEVLTSPGEDIRRGQDLVKVLDCKATVVSAAVSEANFNRLQVGSKASFRLRGEGDELPGRVIGLYGLASVPANLAINQNTLTREPYHVTVEVPALAAGGCQIGRTGIVTFDTSAIVQPGS